MFLLGNFLQVLVELAELQDREVGDGTTSVVIIAAELLKVRFIFPFLSASIFVCIIWKCTKFCSRQHLDLHNLVLYYLVKHYFVCYTWRERLKILASKVHFVVPRYTESKWLGQNQDSSNVNYQRLSCKSSQTTGIHFHISFLLSHYNCIWSALSTASDHCEVICVYNQGNLHFTLIAALILLETCVLYYRMEIRPYC